MSRTPSSFIGSKGRFLALTGTFSINERASSAPSITLYHKVLERGRKGFREWGNITFQRYCIYLQGSRSAAETSQWWSDQGGYWDHTVKMRLFGISNEELRFILVRASVRHCHHSPIVELFSPVPGKTVLSAQLIALKVWQTPL